MEFSLYFWYFLIIYFLCWWACCVCLWGFREFSLNFLAPFDYILFVVGGLMCLFVGLLGFLYFLALFDYMLFVVVACADPGRK